MPVLTAIEQEIEHSCGNLKIQAESQLIMRLFTYSSSRVEISLTSKKNKVTPT